MLTNALLDPRIVAIFRAEFARPDLVIALETTPFDLPGWTSMRTVGLVLAVESAFGLEMTPEEIDGLRCVGDFARVVARSTLAGPGSTDRGA